MGAVRNARWFDADYRAHREALELEQPIWGAACSVFCNGFRFAFIFCGCCFLAVILGALLGFVGIILCGLLVFAVGRNPSRLTIAERLGCRLGVLVTLVVACLTTANLSYAQLAAPATG